MSLVWKLMRRHISLGQLAGFFFANLCGMVIVLLSIQFYQDVAPVFTEGDSFMKKDYIIVSKKVSTLGSLVGKSSSFSRNEIEEIEDQPFTKGVGEFTPSAFHVSAGVGMEQVGLHLSTAMFFESVPDKYVDVNLKDWHFEPGQNEVPIIIPRNYLNLYNFGFAQSRSLPQISEGVILGNTLRSKSCTQAKEKIIEPLISQWAIYLPQLYALWLRTPHCQRWYPLPIAIMPQQQHYRPSLRGKSIYHIGPHKLHTTAHLLIADVQYLDGFHHIIGKVLVELTFYDQAFIIRLFGKRLEQIFTHHLTPISYYIIYYKV